MSLSGEEILLLNEASREGNEEAEYLIKRWKKNNDNSKYNPWNGEEKKSLWKTMTIAGACGLFCLFLSVLFSLLWGAIDMGSSYTEGRHEINDRNYTGWEVGFGTFYFMSFVEGYGDPGLGLMNVVVGAGYIGILYGIFMYIMYATYDGSFYKPYQIEEEYEAIREAAIKEGIFKSQEFEPLLYNKKQLKF